MDGQLLLDTSGLTDAERLAAYETLQNQLDAERLRFTADWDTRKVWAGDGALTGAAWLRHHLGLSTVLSRERTRLAARLRAMPATVAAFQAGDISLEKVRLLAAARTDATAGEFDRDEAELVGFAREFDTDEFSRVMRHWKACADAVGLNDDTHAKALVDGRRASLSQTLDGTVKLDATLDPESGQIVKNTLNDIEQELRRDEQRDIDATAGAVLPRTALQRRADAMVEMARRAGSIDPDTARRPRPEAVIVIPIETLTGSGGVAYYPDGAMISGEAARRMACDAGIARAITNGRSEILDLGRLTPIPPAALRRAAILRDGSCTFVGCDVPAELCEFHHFVAYRRGSETGGPTNLANIGLLCPRHHHLVHEGGFQLSRNPVTGRVETRRPDGTLIPDRPRAGPLDRASPTYTRNPNSSEPSGQGDLLNRPHPRNGDHHSNEPDPHTWKDTA